MKPASRKRWLFPFFLISLSAVEPAFPATLCEGIRSAESTVRKLEGDRSRLESEKAALTTRVDEERARAATQPDRDEEVRRIEWMVAQKNTERDRLQRELSVDRQEAGRLDPSSRRAGAEEARRKLQGDREKLARLEADIQSRLDTDPECAALRKNRDSHQQEYANLFGNQKPEDTLAFLRKNPVDCDPGLRNTNLCEYAKAIGRRGGFSDQTASTPFGIALDDRQKWPVVKSLTDAADAERARLPKLVEELIRLNSDVAGAEKRAAGPDRISERDRLRSEIERAESTSAQSQENLASDDRYLKNLQERIRQNETDLASLEQELQVLAGELERKRRAPSALESAEAELRRVESELERATKELETANAELKSRKSNLEKEIQGISDLLAQSRELTRQAGTAGRAKNEADCQRARRAAMDGLMRASARAVNIGPCRDSSLLEEANRRLQKANTYDCGSGERPIGLVVVPPVKGLKWDEAEGVLRSSGVTGEILISELLAPGNDGEKGRVISTSPPAHQTVRADRLIVVRIFNKTYTDPITQKEDEPKPAAGGGDWDKQAGSARVSAVSAGTPAPGAGTPTPGTPVDSQAEKAREVADKAIAGGPTAEPVITHEGIAGVMATASGIAAARGIRGQSTGDPTMQPGIRDIGPDPLPGVIPRRQTAGNRTVPDQGVGSSMKCTIHSTGVWGNTYYLIEYPGRPAGYEIRRVEDPPTGSAERTQCGTRFGAMKKCIEQEFSGRPVRVLGPFHNASDARRAAQERCR